MNVAPIISALTSPGIAIPSSPPYFHWGIPWSGVPDTQVHEFLQLLDKLDGRYLLLSNSLWSILSASPLFQLAFEPSETQEDVRSGYLGTYARQLVVLTDAYSDPGEVPLRTSGCVLALGNFDNSSGKFEDGTSLVEVDFDPEMTMEQKAASYETMRHIEMVRNMIQVAILEMMHRAERHDQSKMQQPEVSLFTEFTPLLRHVTYGSPEYVGFLGQMKPSLTHHYSKNSHHPEHYPEGVSGMNLFDVLEMLIDWKASGLRHANGSIAHSLDINEKRFGIEPQLMKILRNTVDHLEWETKGKNHGTSK